MFFQCYCFPSSFATVNIEVSDVNDNAPEFIGEPYAAEINEVSQAKCSQFCVPHINIAHSKGTHNTIATYYSIPSTTTFMDHYVAL